MSICLLCDKEVEYGEMDFKLKKETSNGYRTTNLKIHHDCLVMHIWNKTYSHLKLDPFVVKHLNTTESYAGGKGWKVDTFKITNFTQENIDKIEKKLIKKYAKKELLK